MSHSQATMNKSTLVDEKKSGKHHQPQQQQQQQSVTRLVTLFAIVAVIIAQSVLLPAAEARYLPTRSNVDQLKRQEIKEILRLLLDLPESEQRESAQSVWSNGGGASRLADLYELSAIRTGGAALGRHTPSAADMAAISMDSGDSAAARAKRDVNNKLQANKVHF